MISKNASSEGENNGCHEQVLDDLLEPEKLLDWLDSEEGKQKPIRIHSWLNKHA